MKIKFQQTDYITGQTTDETVCTNGSVMTGEPYELEFTSIREIEVSVDNGRLYVSVNGQEVYSNMNMIDGYVEFKVLP